MTGASAVKTESRNPVMPAEDRNQPDGESGSPDPVGSSQDEAESKLRNCVEAEDRNGAVDVICTDLSILVLSHLHRSAKLSEHDALDAFQQTVIDWLRAYLNGSVNAANAVAILITIACRRAKDVPRDRHRRREVPMPVDQRDPPGSPQDDGDPACFAEREEFNAELRNAIRTLPEKQRIVSDVIVRQFPDRIDERGVFVEVAKEVSKITGKEESRQNVRRTWEEARKKLVETLALDWMDDDERQ